MSDEILKQLNEDLDKVRQELGNIKKDYFQKPEEKSASELRLELKAKDEVLENLRNYHQICKKFAEERIPLTTGTKNLSNEFIEIQEDDSATDGHSLMITKKCIPENKEVDMDIEVKNGTVRRRH